MAARRIQTVILAILAVAIAGGVAWWQIRRMPESAPTAGANLALGGPFSLTEHSGRAVTDADYRGRFLLIYFGYTFCPDVCPTELQVMAQVMDRLGSEGERIQPAFVSVDPERDTVPHMAAYVAQFHPRLIGLTGTPEQVAAVARAYRVFYRKSAGSDPAYYTMDHSSFFYLVNPDGSFATVFRGGTSPDDMAQAIRSRLSARG